MKQTDFVTDNPYLAAAITEQLQIDPIPLVQNRWNIDRKLHLTPYRNINLTP